MIYNPKFHHRRSIRLKGYDYSNSGIYFLTLFIQNRACLFGNIIKGQMLLNDFGQIAFSEWIKTPKIRPNVELGEFVVMPNHLHGIIMLHGRGELHSPAINNVNEKSGNVTGKSDESLINDEGECNVTGKSDESLINDEGECNSPLRGPSQTIGAIVRGYKSSVTRQLNLLNLGTVVWQRNYYERIIRNEQSYQTIMEYIKDNPAKWNDDKFFQIQS